MNYPTLEDVLCADRDELQRWHTSLPEPERDVERTVRRRIAKRLEAAAPPQPSPAGPQQKIADIFANATEQQAKERFAAHIQQMFKDVFEKKS